MQSQISRFRDYVIHPIHCVYPWIITFCTISVLCKFTICSFWMVFAMKITISKLTSSATRGCTSNRWLYLYLLCLKSHQLLHSRYDQAYELQLHYGKTRVYCRMSSIPGCGSGGFTLVMKIDGSAVRSQIFCPYEYAQHQQGSFTLRFLPITIHSFEHSSISPIIQQSTHPSIRSRLRTTAQTFKSSVGPSVYVCSFIHISNTQRFLRTNVTTEATS